MGENVANYFNNMTADTTPIEFEKVCLQLLEKTSDFSTLKNVHMEHIK